jgi:hypothetical protein
MISTLLNYFGREVIPRWRKVLLTSEFAIALVVGALLARFGPVLLGAKPTVNEFVSAVAAYAAIAMGFCVAGMTIALTLPNQDLMLRLANKEIDGSHGNALSGLLFVFSWTAFVHWTAVVITLVSLVVAGSDQGLFPPGVSLVRRAVFGSLGGFVLYCLFQFVITIITISQVGEVYIKELRKEAQKKVTGCPPPESS